MKIRKINIILLLFYLCAAILIAIMDKTPLDLDIRSGNKVIENGFYIMYDGIINNSMEAPYPYRFLTPYIIKILSNTFHFSPIKITFFVNIIFIFSVLTLFTKYARYTLSPFIAFLATFMIAFYIIIIQSQFIGITIVESQDILNAIFFLLLLLLAKNEKWFFFGLVSIISIMNRETPLILLVPFSLYLVSKRKIKPLIFINTVALLTYFSIRFFMQVNQGNYPDFTNLRTNFPGINMTYFFVAIKNNILLFSMIGPLIIFAFYNFKKETIYDRLLILVIIPFLIIHYIMGSILEIRLFFPLIVVILPFTIKNLKLIFEKQNNTFQPS